jgi:hypothetical protein
MMSMNVMVRVVEIPISMECRGRGDDERRRVGLVFVVGVKSNGLD